MKLYTLPHRGQMLGRSLPPGAWAVVIDVLRYSTTVSAAFDHGAARAYPAAAEDEARARHAALAGTGALLCGEREGLPLPGFDLGNSPLEFTEARVKDKTLVTLTTNGTLTLRAAASGQAALLGCFANAGALVDAVAAAAPAELFLVCSGKEAGFCIEDFACAGFLARRLFRALPDQVAADPQTIAACRVMADYDNDTRRLLSDSSHGKYLATLGFAADVEYCAEIDIHASVPRLDGEYLIQQPAGGSA